MLELVTSELVERLGAFLQPALQLAEVRTEWPNPGEELSYPCMSILTKRGDWEKQPGRVWKSGPVGENNKASFKYVVGYFELDLQLDIWTATKAARHEAFSRMIEAFTPNPVAPGLNLTLENYHGVIARYDVLGHKFPDNEQAASQSEWRLLFDVSTHCKAIVTKEEFAILNSETQLSNPNEIP